MREAIVLAGGMGTRLQSVVSGVPKPMADINGRPFLAYLLDHLVGQRVDKIILSVCYLHETIVSYFGTSYRSIALEYAVEDEPLGTGGAVMAALPLVTAADVLILNGDTYFPIQLDTLYQYHQDTGSSYTLSLKEMQDASRYGIVEIDRDGRISSLAEKREGASGLINCGVYLVKTSFLSSLTLPAKFSLERDVLEKLFRDFPFYGRPFDCFFVDIGVPEDYLYFNRVAQDLLRA